MTLIADLSSHGKFLKRSRSKDKHLLTISRDHLNLRCNARKNHSTAENSPLSSNNSQLMAANKSSNGKIKRVSSIANSPRNLNSLSKRESL